MALITDRRAADVEYAAALRQLVATGRATEAERQLWQSGNLSGVYNASDMNRVGAAVAELAAALVAAGYGVTPPAARLDWAAGEIPSQEGLAGYLAAVAWCRRLAEPPPLPQSMSGLDWEGANEIETALETVAARLVALGRGLSVCGPASCGGGLYSAGLTPAGLVS